MTETIDDLTGEIRGCRLCADRFLATATGHTPRPVVWFSQSARILIAGQAPGARVYNSGRPFTDPSGDRLRDWLGMNETEFYDQSQVAIVPMGFCFPGYNANKADLPPPPICARTWHARVMAQLPKVEIKVLIGAHAQRWHLNHKGPVTELVHGWRDHAPQVFPLPHPSWRNTAWLKKNPWFETDLLPVLQARLRQLMK